MQDIFGYLYSPVVFIQSLMARRLSNPESRSKNYAVNDTTVEYSILQYNIHYDTGVYGHRLRLIPRK